MYKNVSGILRMVVLTSAAAFVCLHPSVLDASAGDFSISSMGGSNTTDLGAAYPAVAYNDTGLEYLVVWEGDHLTDEEYEIWGQRIDAATGLAIGTLFRISDMGPEEDTSYEARNPAVVYNATDDEYLVVWWGDDSSGALVNDEFEIFGQRIDATTGVEAGTNDFRISDMGTDGSTLYGAFYPRVAYDTTDNEYLVVWEGDDSTAPLVDGESEIFAQRLDAATGAETGTNDFRISDMGPDGDVNYGAFKPDISYNATAHEYLAVWTGDDNTASLVNDEFEIYGQRLQAPDGTETGTNDFRISDMGPDGNVNYSADNAAIAYDSNNNRYFVVWEGDDNQSPLVDGELEIFGQRLDGATAAETGDNDFRISDTGTDGSIAYGASDPAIAFHRYLDEFLVAWSADDTTGDLANDEYEVFAQRIDADGTDLSGDFRLSAMGTAGSADYDAFSPAVVYNTDAKQFISVWSGDDDTNEEFEIYGKIFYISSSCGDHFLDDVEECDDGNTVDGDGCSTICLIETGETTDLITSDVDNTDGDPVDPDTYFVIIPDSSEEAQTGGGADTGGSGDTGSDAGTDSGSTGDTGTESGGTDDSGSSDGGTSSGDTGNDSGTTSEDSGSSGSDESGDSESSGSSGGSSGGSASSGRRSSGSGGGCSLMPEASSQG